MKRRRAGQGFKSAYEAGIQVGDILIGLGDKKVSMMTEMDMA